jgi:glutathione S-transferase
VVVGLLVGEGSFGGDGKQPQVTLRMHVRHEAIFRWLAERFPDSRLYGPYHHGGRSYFQWMARGTVLVRDLLPLLEAEVTEALDGHAAERFRDMCSRYAAFISRERERLERHDDG